MTDRLCYILAIDLCGDVRESDVDGEFYTSALQELESLIVAQQQFLLEDLKNDNSED